jgi:SAP domain
MIDFHAGIHLLRCEQATCKGWWHLRTGGITSTISSHVSSFVAQNRSAPVFSGSISDQTARVRGLLGFSGPSDASRDDESQGSDTRGVTVEWLKEQTREELHGMTAAALKVKLADLGLPVSGSMTTLVDRLVAQKNGSTGCVMKTVEVTTRTELAVCCVLESTATCSQEHSLQFIWRLVSRMRRTM